MATADRKIEINTNMVISTNPPTPTLQTFLSMVVDFWVSK
jgi:hypothetical protein